MKMTPGQYQKWTAYHPVIGDPLLVASVEIVKPEWQTRTTGEIEAWPDARRLLMKEGVRHIPGASKR